MAEGESLSLGHSCVKEAFATGLEAALRLEDHAKVEDILGTIRAGAVGRRMRFYRAHVARIEAQLPDRSDEEAERLFEDSVAAFRDIQMPFQVAIVLLESAEWMQARGREADAGPRAEEARSIFDGLGAKPWLERVSGLGRRSAVTS